MTGPVSEFVVVDFGGVVPKLEIRFVFGFVDEKAA